jgi:cardiolipin synthase
MPEAVSPPLAGLAHLVGRATGQSLTGGNRIEPLVDGEQAYPAMLAAIESARYSVALTSYIFDSQGIGAQFVDALRRAHERGVQVRVLIDDVYARWTPRSAYRALQRAGVPAATFNPTLIPARLHAAHLRNHRKLLVIDGETGFTGGMNIFRSYWRPDAPDQACHDLHFRLRGPVVEHLMRSFTDDWCDTTGERLSKGFWGEPPVTADEPGTSWARGIEAGPDEALDRMRWTFMGALSAAKHSVRIWTPYFVPDQPMIAALSTAALRGVRIDVLTPANGDHPTVQWAARAHYWQVLEHGVRIFERPGPFDHSKLMLVDGAWCCLGSANWDARSLRLNFEFNVEVYDTALSTRLESLLMPLVMRRARYRRRRCAPARWPSACATGWPVCSPPFSSDTTSRNTAHGKERSMEHWLLDRRRPVAADAVEPLAGGEDRRAGALQRVREGAGRGARGRSAGVGSHGDRAPEVAGQPGQDDDRGNEGRTRSCRSPVEVRRTLCPRVGEHLAERCAVVDPASGILLWRLVLPVPPLRREAGHGRVSQHR